MAWDVQFRNGIHLPQLGWWLDAHHPVARSFVSHAHFDHLAPHREVLLSPGTAALMRARMPDRVGDRVERLLPFGEAAPLSADHPEVTVTLHPAGHIHGSAMILLDHPAHGRLLYTGDFKLRPGRSAELCDPPRADLVIMETTYGRPHYKLPPTDAVLASVIAFCRAALDEGDTPVLFGYSLGKSQEILRSLAGAALPVMLHPQTLKLTAVYESLGITFPPYAAFDAATCAGHVVLCPPQAANSPFVRKIPRRRAATLTGWALDPGARFRYQCDAAFPLSDHADYPDLLRFVELTQPKRVLTLHGFATDFARDLRDRGLDAWAINQDNQLEIPLAASVPPPVFPDTAASSSIRGSDFVIRHSSPGGDVGPADIAAEAGLDALAATAERIRTTASKLEKIALLRDHFATLAPDDAARVALYLTGRAFPQADPRSLNTGWSLLRRAVLEVSGHHEGDFRAAYRRFGDSGDTAEALLAAPKPGTPPPASTLASLALADLETLLARLAASSPSAKLDLLIATLRGLSPLAAKYLVKIITGDLRIGLREGLVEEAVAAAAGRAPDALREANLLCGDLPAVVRAAFADTLAAITLRVFHPLQFMLASPEPTAAALLARFPPPLWLEEKYDGIRCQLHKQGARVELYSRDLNRITGQFPELARAAARELPGDCILDGELLAWRGDRALPFAELQKRLNRRLDGDDLFLGQEIPIAYSAYDLLWLDNASLLRSPLRTRRTSLESLFPDQKSLIPNHKSLHLAPLTFATTPVEVEAAFLRARQRGNEGLMAKDPASPYTPGRRGLAWLKLKKAYATLDVVVVAVELGHGKRRGVLSDYTFAVRDEATGALRTVGKAYSGLTDVEIAALTEHFIANTLEVDGRVRRVVPDTVLEIAFDRIQPSARHDSGFALRFPRIARIRTDKTPADIDTLATCRHLAAATAAPPYTAPLARVEHAGLGDLARGGRAQLRGLAVVRIQDPDTARVGRARGEDHVASVGQPARLHRVGRLLRDQLGDAGAEVVHRKLETLPAAHREHDLVGVGLAPIRLRAVAADARGQPLRRPARGRHDVELGAARRVRGEDELRAVRRPAGARLDRGGAGLARDLPPRAVADVDLRVALAGEYHRHIFSVRAETRAAVGALETHEGVALQRGQIELKNIGEARAIETRVEQALPVRRPTRGERESLVVGDLAHVAEEEVADVDLGLARALADEGQPRREKAGLARHRAHRRVRRLEQGVARRAARHHLAQHRRALPARHRHLHLVGRAGRGKGDPEGGVLRLPAERAMGGEGLVRQRVEFRRGAGHDDGGVFQVIPEFDITEVVRLLRARRGRAERRQHESGDEDE